MNNMSSIISSQNKRLERLKTKLNSCVFDIFSELLFHYLIYYLIYYFRHIFLLFLQHKTKRVPDDCK